MALDDFGGAGYAIPFYNATLVGQEVGKGLGLFGGGKRSGPDISGELAKIGALFEAQREAARAAVASQAKAQGTQARNNLATRGTLRSPVSEHVFGEIRRGEQDAYAQALGQIAGQEAGVRANIMSQLLGYDQQARALQGQQKAALFSQGGSLLSSLLLASILKNPAPLLAAVGPGAAAGAGQPNNPLSFFGRSSASYGSPMAGG